MQALTAVRRELLAARLGLHSKLTAQVAVFEKEIEEAKKLEAITKVQVESGTTTSSALLMATAYRLGVEIQLADAQAAEARGAAVRKASDQRVRRRSVVLPPSSEKK